MYMLLPKAFIVQVFIHMDIGPSSPLSTFGYTRMQTHSAFTLMYFSSLRIPHGTTQTQFKLIKMGLEKLQPPHPGVNPVLLSCSPGS